MAISRKPRAQAGQSVTSDVDVAALISKGGSIAGSEPAPSPTPRSTLAMTLRLPGHLAEQLDAHLEQSPIRIPRHHWILEAIVERLERETRQSSLP